jgi:hypothetical protein
LLAFKLFFLAIFRFLFICSYLLPFVPPCSSCLSLTPHIRFLFTLSHSLCLLSLTNLFLSSLSKVVGLAEGLLQSRATKARGLSSASLLLQPKNQVLLQVSNFIIRLREGVRYALSISDTTQSEKFAEAKAAWASVQTLLLEATKVKLN